MSDMSVSALSNAQYDGSVQVADTGLRGMITLRGDLADKGLAKAVKAATGLGVPKQRQVLTKGSNGVAWMSPDELLIMVPYSAATQTAADLQLALSGQHALVANVSDARAVFRIAGAGCREVIAKLAPVDMASDKFAPCTIRRTRIAQIAAAFWMVDEETAELVCFRSVAQYAFDILIQAAKNGPVDFHLPKS